MSAAVLLVVDMQRDFCEGGTLPITGGSALAEAIQKFLQEKSLHYRWVIASQDWHNPPPDNNGGHFADDVPDFVESWPLHCVADTEGADFHPALASLAWRMIVRKGQGVPAYSVFEGSVASGMYEGANLASVLRTQKISRLDICGMALDYCVKASAIDAAKAGLRPRVLADLTASVAPYNNDDAISAMTRAGVGFTSSQFA